MQLFSKPSTSVYVKKSIATKEHSLYDDETRDLSVTSTAVYSTEQGTFMSTACAICFLEVLFIRYLHDHRVIWNNIY